MERHVNKIFAISALVAISTLIMDTQKAEAFRLFKRGQNGSVGAYDGSSQYGSRRGARALGRNAGGGVRQSNLTGVNGATEQSQGAFAYQKGVGAQRGGSWSGTNAQGVAGSGFTKNQYNAQTGQGLHSSSEQAQNINGKDYGYNGSTDYTKGQGATSIINTDNKGSYDVNWQPGQKPIVTSVPNSQ